MIYSSLHISGPTYGSERLNPPVFPGAGEFIPKTDWVRRLDLASMQGSRLVRIQPDCNNDGKVFQATEKVNLPSLYCYCSMKMSA
jgi:hypothetical protein